MSETKHNADQAAKRWQLLWSCFSRIIDAQPAQQDSLMLKLKEQHPELFPELENLIASHGEKTSILDKDPINMELASAFEPPASIKGYEILEPLGRGGLGDVYKAQKKEAGHVHAVAIKFATTGQYSPLVLDSFNNELNMLMGLNHPNIERLFEGGVTAQGIPYLVVEYIDGQHIDTYCDANSLDLRARIKLFLQVCDAVSAMHQSLIIHRDIKASNIMVNADGVCKLLDFGLAKLTEQPGQVEPSQQTYSSLMMTLAYASPEQIRGKGITTSSDVYSLGMLLYYLLAGQLPYTIDPNDLVGTTQQINATQPPPASNNIKPEAVINASQNALAKRLKGELDAILNKAINKDPSRRYESANQLADDLIRYLKNEPVKAKPDAAMYRVKKFIQRHTAGVFTTAAVMLSLLALSLLLLQRTEQLKSALLATQAEQQRVSQVTEFLVDVFKLSDPLQNQSEVVDVKSLIDHAADQLQQQFIQQPETKARLHQTLAEVYLNMSEIDSAEALLKQAKTANSNTESQLSLLLLEVALLQKKGQPIQALDLLDGFEQKLAASQQESELSLGLTLTKALSKGQLQYQLGQLDAAVMTLTGAGELMAISNAGSWSIEQAKAAQLQADIEQLLGNVYWKKGDLNQVKTHYEKSYQSNLDRLGQAHHATLKSLSALGVLAYSQGDFELARSRFEQVLDTRVEQLGENHYLTADAHNRLGATEYELGQLAAAEAHYEKALQAFNVSGLGDSIKFTRVLNNLGLIKRQQKAYPQAQQLFQQALQIQSKQLGADHADLAAMYNNLGLVAHDQNDHAQAIDWFKKSYQVQFDTHGTEHVNIAFAMTNLARMHSEIGELEQAQSWINQALRLRAKHLGTEHLLYAASLVVEAEWALAAKKREKAAKSAEKALKIRESRLEKNDWRVAESRHLWLSLQPQNDDLISQMCLDAKTVEQQFGVQHPSVTALQQRHKAVDNQPCLN
ncbi:serine/threonine-protein kinase [Marinicella sp. S1101]|uniref:serine/threonine-protein kinase n=1 Tax=Marinicella marina TaxID=2996016 RepID=UPI002260BE1C|nr:serine/threonine-protein kinase [Marinicella marina]MCX7553114.1 serine/threonine-protein kinase [Marinicella marina]MDJ1138846.1 serine/threonine-protein kinase [Marinicella marina]